MALRILAQGNPELAAFKETIAPVTTQLEQLGWAYWVYMRKQDVVGIVCLGKEPLQLFAPVGTPLARFFILDYKQPLATLKEFIAKAFAQAKESDRDFAYLNIDAEQSQLADYLITIGFEQLANRYEMTRSLDAQFEVSDMLQFERVQRHEVDQFFRAMREFMSGSPDVVLDMVMKNITGLPEQIIDIWYAQVQLFFVYKDDELIGTLDLSPEASYINNIGVAPQHRGKGYGSEMLRFSLKLLQTEDCKSANLGLHVNNQRAFHVYEKLGFSIQSQIQTFIWWK